MRTANSQVACSRGGKAASCPRLGYGGDPSSDDGRPGAATRGAGHCRAPDEMGAAHRSGRRTAAGRRVPAGRGMAAGARRPGAAGGRAGRPGPAGVVLRRAGLRRWRSSSRCSSWLVNVAWYAWVALAVAVGGHLRACSRSAQRLLLRLPGWPLAVAGWWVAAEAVRDRWPWGGFPWGRLAMSQAGAPDRRLGGGRRAAAADLPGRARRRDAWAGSSSPSGPRGAARSSGRRAAAPSRWRPPPSRRRPAWRPAGPAPARPGARRRPHRRGGRHPGRRAPGAEPGHAAQRLDGHQQPRGRHGSLARQGRRRARRPHRTW